MNFLHMLYALNRGLVSPLALARLDLKRMALAASTMTNWIPRVLGSMMLRPGMGMVTTTRSDLASAYLEFIFGTSDTALVELTDGNMRVLVSDVVVTRPAVTSTFNDWNGAAFVAGTDVNDVFVDAADVAKWRDNDESGAVSAFLAGGYLSLLGTGLASAIRDRSVAVAGANVSKEHALTIVVARGSVILRLGSTEGGEQYLEDRVLRAGQHSIAITPTGAFFIRLSNYRSFATLVDSVTIVQAAGDMVIPTPWAAANLDNVRYTQSGDVIFAGCKDIMPKRIERQDRTSTPASRSWSVVDYAPEDGPFGDLNVGPVEMQVSALTGDVNLTASKAFFKAGHVGSLFRLESAGQQVIKQITGQNVFSDPIRVTGVGSTRAFTITLAGPTFTGTTTVTLQRSVGTPGSWTDQASYTAVQTVAFNDLLDNQVIYYRIGVKTGNYTVADDILATLTYTAGSIDGICRVNSITSTTVAAVSVLKSFGASAVNTQNWWQGDWSPGKGYPSAVTLFGGRMGWAGKALWWMSAADLFDNFDDTREGTDSTIRGTLGSGPVDVVNWMMPLNNLMIGAEGEALVAQASTVSGPLTPSDRGLKSSTDVGTAPLRGIRVDTQGIFVARNGSQVYMLSADANLYSTVPYIPEHLTDLVPEIGESKFRRIAVQRAKDTRIHCVRTDGKVAVMVFDKLEKVKCWLLVETDGVIEDVAVLPGTSAAPLESQVYYVVKRTVNGSTKRFLEKWALESQAVGGASNRIADCHVTGTLSGTTTVPVAHLEGETVWLWGNSKDLGAYEVVSGVITASEAITGAYCVGLGYDADWQSAKLSVGSQAQVPLTQFKNIHRIGLVMQEVDAQGVKYGMDFDHLDDLPAEEGGEFIDPDYLWPQYDAMSMPLDGEWNTDARICLRASAPRPATVLGIVISGEGHDRV